MQEQFEAGVIIEAPVIDHNKGGLIVDCGIRGFVPISQIVDFPRRPQNEQPRDAAQEIAEKLQPYVGRRLRLKILEVNRKANRLILSEKVALYEERREKRDELFSSLQVGQKVTGSVRSIAPFGVFIDLGGIDGLVHKSELSWNKVNNPEAGYKVGEEVEAEVIDINHERGRISLSIRRLQPDPWHSTVADFRVGDVIDGTVTKLVNFGAFVRVRDGLEGLIHISELQPPACCPPGRRGARGPDAEAEDHLARLRAASPGSQPEAGRGAAGPAVRVARGAAAPRSPGAGLLALRRRPGAGGRDRQHAGRRVRAGAPAARGGRAASRSPSAEPRGCRRARAGGRGRRRAPTPEAVAEPEPEAVAEPRRRGRRRAGEPEAVAEPEPEAEAVAEPEPAGRGGRRARAGARPSPSPRPSPSRSRGARAEAVDPRSTRREQGLTPIAREAPRPSRPGAPRSVLAASQPGPAPRGSRRLTRRLAGPVPVRARRAVVLA